MIYYMPIPETKMPDEFYDWLDKCPTQWLRIGVEKSCINYSFIIPNPDQDED